MSAYDATLKRFSKNLIFAKARRTRVLKIIAVKLSKILNFRKKISEKQSQNFEKNIEYFRRIENFLKNKKMKYSLNFQEFGEN